MSLIQKSLRFTGMFSATAGSLVAIIQLILLLFKQDTICFNDGCQIVETLTTVSPIIFNLAGFLFFQAVFWTLYYTKLKDSHWPILSQALLLAGLGAEGVLVGYQQFVAQVFCSYCLIIFGIIVFLNLLQGFKHIVFAFSLFIAIQVGFASLQFNTPTIAGEFPLDRGTITTMEATDKEKQFYFIFSATCPHCEDVMETLEEHPQYPISFNPVDVIKELPVPGKHDLSDYDNKVNRSFLGNFGVNEIPVLLVKEGKKFTIIHGKNHIIETIKENCYPKEISFESSSPAEFNLDQIAPQSQEDENCTIDSDC